MYANGYWFPCDWVAWFVQMSDTSRYNIRFMSQSPKLGDSDRFIVVFPYVYSSLAFLGNLNGTALSIYITLSAWERLETDDKINYLWDEFHVFAANGSNTRAGSSRPVRRGAKAHLPPGNGENFQLGRSPNFPDLSVRVRQHGGQRVGNVSHSIRRVFCARHNLSGSGRVTG